MKKFLPVVLILVVVLAACLWVFWGKGKPSQKSGLSSEVKRETEEKSESFSGRLKEIVARQVPVKCVYFKEGNSATTFVKGNKIYSEFTVQGKSGYVIVVDKCMWSWNKGEAQGINICFEKNIWEGGEETGTLAAEVEYNCSPAIISDSQFDLPKNVKFLSLQEMMRGGQ